MQLIFTRSLQILVLNILIYNLAHSKITYYSFEIFVQQNILRLYILMDDPVLVQIIKPINALSEKLSHQMFTYKHPVHQMFILQ